MKCFYFVENSDANSSKKISKGTGIQKNSGRPSLIGACIPCHLSLHPFPSLGYNNIFLEFYVMKFYKQYY